MVRKQQLFSVLGEIVPYKKFKKRGGEPFFTCILRGGETFFTYISGPARRFHGIQYPGYRAQRLSRAEKYRFETLFCKFRKY